MNSGTRATGKYQSSVTFNADNPLQLNDIFYVTHNNDLGGGNAGIAVRTAIRSTIQYLLAIPLSVPPSTRALITKA
jgi:hemolysin activation/secretion protein